MPKYVLCPRCELIYILEGEEYCDVCKAELKKGPQLVFAVDEDDDNEVMELCPKCHRNYLKPGQTICRECAKLSEFEEERTTLDDDDESWKEYLDDDTPEEDEEDSEEMLSLAKLAEEEGEELFEDEEEEIEMEQVDEPDDESKQIQNGKSRYLRDVPKILEAFHQFLQKQPQLADFLARLTNSHRS